MPDTPGSLIRHAALAACLTLSLVATVRAQSPQDPPPAPDFLTRYDFHLSANSLSGEDADERFSWDAHFGGDLDLVDYVVGRASILVDYEAILGDEFRAFDPNQSYYVLEASSSVRVSGVEIAGIFHHVSRHLSDRPKRFPIAWNVLGARVLKRVEASGTIVDIRGEAGKVVQHSYVDYSWTTDLDLMIRHPVAPRVGVFAHGYGEIFGVNGTIFNRGSQQGGRVEGGVRFEGGAGALELFAGIERRLDADPADLLPVRSVIAGFRLLGK
jgi:hypothetical protein